MSPPSFPPQAPSSGRPLPSAGSPGAGSPTSQVLSADSDFSPPVAHHFVSFAQHYHRFALFAPLGPDVSPRAWTTSIAAPAPPLHGGEDEISQVPGRPLRTCPALRPRRTAIPRPLQGCRWGLPRSRPRRLRHAPISGLHHAACTLSVYASQPGSPPVCATLDSGRWPTLTGRDSHPLGRVEDFRRVFPFTSPSLLTKLCLAQREMALPPTVSIVVWSPLVE